MRPTRTFRIASASPRSRLLPPSQPIRAHAQPLIDERDLDERDAALPHEARGRVGLARAVDDAVRVERAEEAVGAAAPTGNTRTSAISSRALEMASAISGTWQTSATRGRSSARPMRVTFTQAFERVELALDGEDGAVELARRVPSGVHAELREDVLHVTLDGELGDAERAGDLAVPAPTATSLSTSSSRGEDQRHARAPPPGRRSGAARRSGGRPGRGREAPHRPRRRGAPGGARPARSPCAGRRSLRRGRRRGSRSGRGRSPRRSCARRRSREAGGRAGRLLPAARRGRRAPRREACEATCSASSPIARTSKSPSRQSRFVTPDRKIGSGSAIRTRVTEGSPSPRVAMAGAEPRTRP